eukprot:jgi/Tetstr1/454443/TSEL_041343.t1
MLALDDLPCRDDINETVSAAADVVERADQYLAEAEDSLAKAKETRALIAAAMARAHEQISPEPAMAAQLEASRRLEGDP